MGLIGHSGARTLRWWIGHAGSILIASGVLSCSSQTTPPRADTRSNTAPSASTTASNTSPGRALVVGTAPPQAIVSLEPTTAREYPPLAEPRVMDQYNLSFSPDLLLVRVGQPVEFRSSDDVLHNVRVDESATNAPEFNVATPPHQAYTHVFTKAGYYDVSCDIHSGMHANIFVSASPYTVLSDDRGAFTLDNVEPGSYKLTVLGGGRTIEREVKIVAPRTSLQGH